MKSIILKSVAVVLITSLISCSKTQHSPAIEYETVSKDAIIQVLKSSDLAIQKNMYRALNIDEKRQVWTTVPWHKGKNAIRNRITMARAGTPFWQVSER